jgi:putative transposase
MSNLYDKGFRSVYVLTAHIVFVTKYRRQVISKEIHARLQEIFNETCQKWEVSLVEFNGESDHVHLLIRYHPQIQLSKFIANLKTVSSRLIRKDFAEHLSGVYRKPVFWAGSYLVASCGGVTVEQLKEYVKQQEAPRATRK